jgi:hypothetical protein
MLLLGELVGVLRVKLFICFWCFHLYLACSLSLEGIEEQQMTLKWKKIKIKIDWGSSRNLS